MHVTSTITYPTCATQTTEQMEENACRFFYTCPACGAQLQPRDGDCCVFCSYGDVPCLPQQTNDAITVFTRWGDKPYRWDRL